MITSVTIMSNCPDFTAHGYQVESSPGHIALVVASPTWQTLPCQPPTPAFGLFSFKFNFQGLPSL